MREHLRQCVVCRRMADRAIMIKLTHCRQQNRFSLNSQPAIQGRSAYICRVADCLNRAIREKRLQRSLKCLIPDGIVDALKALSKDLVDRALDKSS